MHGARTTGRRKPRTRYEKGRLSPARPLTGVAAARRDEKAGQTLAVWRVRATARPAATFLREDPAREGMLHSPHT